MYTMYTNILFYLVILMIIISYLLFFSSLRKKFIIFILIIFFFSMWGFLFHLDGMMLVFLTTEFTVLLFFIMTYVQISSNYIFLISKKSYANIVLLFVLYIFTKEPQYYSISTISYYNFVNHIVSSDFFILYYFLFEKLPLLVVFLTLIISFFSFFFILLYFNLKLTKQTSKATSNLVYFLRKQNLIKQSSFSNNLYTFQN